MVELLPGVTRSLPLFMSDKQHVSHGNTFCTWLRVCHESHIVCGSGRKSVCRPMIRDRVTSAHRRQDIILVSQRKYVIGTLDCRRASEATSQHVVCERTADLANPICPLK